jgi:hypothetical protein
LAGREEARGHGRGGAWGRTAAGGRVRAGDAPIVNRAAASTWSCCYATVVDLWCVCLVVVPTAADTGRDDCVVGARAAHQMGTSRCTFSADS